MNSRDRNRVTWRGYIVLWIATSLFAIPAIWLLVSSFKPLSQLTSDPYSFWPRAWRWQNYIEAIQATSFRTQLRNTLLLACGRTIGTLLSCSLAAYAFARLRWRGRGVLFLLLIATMLLPWHVTMIPRFLLLREIGLYNTLAALIVPSFLGTAFSIFLLRQFFLTIPEELSEAARLDGLSEFSIYWRIILPLSKPALITVGLFQFIAAWNDFSGPLLYLSDPQKFPLAYGLEQFLSSYSDQTHLLLAASVLFCLPMVVLFLIAQRYFVRGIATSGLKG